MVPTVPQVGTVSTMFRTRYVRFLEQENAELKAKLERYESVLIPRLAHVGGSLGESPARAASVAADEKGSDRAGTGKSSMRPGRVGWQYAKSRLEALFDPEVSGKQIKI